MGRFQVQQPPAAQENPYFTPAFQPLVFEQFNGINTNTTRPGVKDEQMWWCDGFMPLGPMFLRTLPGIGPALFTAPAGTTLVFFDFANISTTPYMIAFISDGSIYAINTVTAVATKIANAGTITNPTRTSVGISQYGSQYVIIVSSQANGYFLWDGTTLYQAGTLAPGVVLTNNGSGYGSTPTVTVGASGATFSVAVVGGIVNSVTLLTPGSGFTATSGANQTISLTFTGGSPSVSAAGYANLMPFAISGTSVETYSGHVWVALNATTSFTAPGSVTNFATSAGGGNFTSTDSYLRVAISQLRATNGFLYFINDSSVDYLSGVTTTGSPPTTSFNKQNADPEVGTPYPATVDVFNRNILFANSFGAHVSYGAAVTKISEALDGVYSTVPNFGGFVPSAAKAIIFGKKVWILLIPIIDPVTQTQQNKLFMWNGKIWWASTQDLSMQYVQHQEINSVITAWGTNGLAAYPLFQQPSTGFRKVVQSKLWATQWTYAHVKTAVRLWGLVQYQSVSSPSIDVSIDNEFGVAVASASITPRTVSWTTPPLTMSWTTAGGTPMTWFIGGITAEVPQAVGQNGVLLGLTAATNVDDAIIISLMLLPEDAGYRG